MNPYDLPDHPVIRNMERTGFPDGRELDIPHCPVCGQPCETVYQNRYGDWVGCDQCVDGKYAWDEEDCFPPWIRRRFWG